MCYVLHNNTKKVEFKLNSKCKHIKNTQANKYCTGDDPTQPGMKEVSDFINKHIPHLHKHSDLKHKTKQEHNEQCMVKRCKIVYHNKGKCKGRNYFNSHKGPDKAKQLDTIIKKVIAKICQ